MNTLLRKLVARPGSRTGLRLALGISLSAIFVSGLGIVLASQAAVISGFLTPFVGPETLPGVVMAAPASGTLSPSSGVAAPGSSSVASSASYAGHILNTIGRRDGPSAPASSVASPQSSSPSPVTKYAAPYYNAVQVALDTLAPNSQAAVPSGGAASPTTSFQSPIGPTNIVPVVTDFIPSRGLLAVEVIGLTRPSRTSDIQEGRALLASHVVGVPSKPVIAVIAEQRYLHIEADMRPAMAQYAGFPFVKTVARYVSFSGLAQPTFRGSMEIVTRPSTPAMMAVPAISYGVPPLTSAPSRFLDTIEILNGVASPVQKPAKMGSYPAFAHTSVMAAMPQGIVAPGETVIVEAVSPQPSMLYGVPIVPADLPIPPVVSVIVPAHGPAMDPPVQTNIPGVPSVLQPAGFSLTVQILGTGVGDVSSVPGGIDCGSDCAEDYTAPTQVTLHASPQPGSFFVGWGGACAGASIQCIVDVDDRLNVTATFAPIPPVPAAGLPSILALALALGALGFWRSRPRSQRT